MANQHRSSLRRLDPETFAAFCYTPRERRRLARFYAGRGRRSGERVGIQRPLRTFTLASIKAAIALSNVPRGMPFTIDSAPGVVTVKVPNEQWASATAEALAFFDAPGIVKRIEWSEPKTAA